MAVLIVQLSTTTDCTAHIDNEHFLGDILSD
jgi:hypothetical protein